MTKIMIITDFLDDLYLELTPEQFRLFEFLETKGLLEETLRYNVIETMDFKRI